MTDNLTPFIADVLQILLALAAGPLFVGWVRMLKCRMQGRRSAGIFQPYRDLQRLFIKDVVLAHHASWIFRFTPYLVFGSTLLIAGVIPIISTELSLAATADVIALVAVLALGRFFLALSGMDTGTAFGGMGSSREMMVASLAEPATLMSVFTISLVAKSTSLSQMAQTIIASPLALHPSLAFAMLSFALIALAETGRIPIDNPTTHLELTMLHEAMLLEYSGRHLALIEWASMMKLTLYAALGIALFAPWGVAPEGAPLYMLIPAAASFAVKLAFVGAGIVLIETGLAKMRIFMVTEYLGMAFLLATLGMLSFFMLE